MPLLHQKSYISYHFILGACVCVCVCVLYVCVCVCVCVCVQEVGTLEVSGYVRGKPLSVNGLLYIPGLGEFQMAQVHTP